MTQAPTLPLADEAAAPAATGPAPVSPVLAQPSLAPSYEASGARNPPHTSTESTMAPTSEFVRYFLLALPSRYIFRGMLGIATDSKIGNPDNSTAINRLFVPLRKGVDSLIDRFITGKLETEINGHLQQHPLQLPVGPGRENPTNSATTHALREGHGSQLRRKTNHTLGRWDASALTHDTIQWAYGNNTDKPVITPESKNKIRGHVKHGLYGMMYGHTLGIGSSVLTASYSSMVFRDMKNIFSEAVAYELGKDAGDVTFRDIRKSDNRIVQSTVSNWRNKTLSRFATDALFFVGAFGKSERFADLVLGIKGMQVLLGTWKREPTMFEQITTLINNKINPRNGLGQPITAGDVFDLYQHYNLSFAPAKAFTHVIDNDARENRSWIDGKVVFDRITELLNDTYAYKHATAIDPHTRQPVIRANFALPKFIYLLGHDMIDPAKPAETLLTVEVANSIGMQAVRELQAELKRGTPLAELTERFMGTPPQTLIETVKAKTPSYAPSFVGTEEIPASLLSSERRNQGTLIAREQALAP